MEKQKVTIESVFLITEIAKTDVALIDQRWGLPVWVERSNMFDALNFEVGRNFFATISSVKDEMGETSIWMFEKINPSPVYEYKLAFEEDEGWGEED